MDKKTAVKKALGILTSFQEAGRKYQNINGDEHISDGEYDAMLAALRGMEQDMLVKQEGDDAVQKAACELKDQVQARSDELKVTRDDFEGNFKQEVIGEKVRDIVGSASAAKIGDQGLKDQIALLMKHHGIERARRMVDRALAEYLVGVADRAKP
jgi:predicted secreted protein